MTGALTFAAGSLVAYAALAVWFVTAGGSVDRGGGSDDVGTRGVSPKRQIFAFLRSRGARLQCPFCGSNDWEGWDERIALGHVGGSFAVNRGAQAFPLTCRNCGFIRLQAAHVLDDPRASSRNDPDEEPPMPAPPGDAEANDRSDAVE